jgi:hypothetical protein
MAGCAAPPPKPAEGPVEAPRVAASVSHEPGSPLAGGAGDHAETASVASSLPVLVTFVALARIPRGLLDPLSAHARVIVELPGERALAAQPKLFSGALAGVTSDAVSFPGQLPERANRFADLRAALPRGVTASFTLERAGDDVRIHVHRRPDDARIEIAVEVTHATEPGGAGVGELAAFDATPLGREGGFVTIVRSPFAGEPAKAIAAIVQVGVPPGEDAPGAAAHREACIRCNADLARDVVFRRERSSRPSRTTPPRPDLGAAIRALSRRDEQRSALFLLAQEGGAPLAEELALSADERLLGSVCETVARAARAPGAPADGPELGWLVERAALDGVRDLAREGDLPPATQVLLVRRSGGVARSLGTFFALVDASQSLGELEQRFRQENLDLLEDSSPATRARAYEWLAERALAPAGYDPLAPAAERRAALDRAAAAANAPAKTKEGTP